MGNYLFNHDVLIEVLVEDARRSTDHDFGRTIIPELVPHLGVYAYNFMDNAIPGIRPHEEAGYWRDVGTIAGYWHAHMDLLGPEPRFDLDNDRWPILSAPYRGPSTRIILGDVTDSILGEGTLIDGGTVRRSIIGRGVRVGRGAAVEDSIIMERTTIAPGAAVRRAIIDRYNAIPEGQRIGEDGEADRRRYHVDSSGLIVVPRGQTR